MVETLRKRFFAHMSRHPNIEWEDVETRIKGDPTLLRALTSMEESGGEPDVLLLDDGALILCDFAKETPLLRRSLCYDDAALKGRTKNPPKGDACSQAKEMGVSLVDEAIYRKMQSIEEIDLKTSSWIATPKEIREKGGALFMERRYGRTFVFHNGADSYYSVRGWRGYIVLK